MTGSIYNRNLFKECGCGELSLGNNIECRLYCVVCIPRKYMRGTYGHNEEYSDALPTLNMASLRYTNFSMVYFGNISEIGTSIPMLCRRQSLAKTERDKPIPYKPVGAEVPFDERLDVLRIVLSQMARPECTAFNRFLTTPDKTMACSGTDWYRFPSQVGYRIHILYFCKFIIGNLFRLRKLKIKDDFRWQF